MEIKIGTNIVLLDDADSTLLTGKSLYLDDKTSRYRYACITERGRHVRLHTLLLGKQPRGRCIDHVNGDTLDNRRQNLRVVGWKENQVNRKGLNRNNTSGYRGVHYFKCGQRARRWAAVIMVNYRSICLGYFSTKEEAQAARRVGELKHYGQICPTNEVHP